ncbi:hypothetical protein DIPPA_05934 [Diplonema papillatum]|nr:hypothetical protein DIPPA_05934 [Diplonema papillatum]
MVNRLEQSILESSNSSNALKSTASQSTLHQQETVCSQMRKKDGAGRRGRAIRVGCRALTPPPEPLSRKRGRKRGNGAGLADSGRQTVLGLSLTCTLDAPHAYQTRDRGVSLRTRSPCAVMPTTPRFAGHLPSDPRSKSPYPSSPQQKAAAAFDSTALKKASAMATEKIISRLRKTDSDGLLSSTASLTRCGPLIILRNGSELLPL